MPDTFYTSYSNPHSPRWGDTSSSSVIVKVTFDGFAEEVDFQCFEDETEQLHAIELRTNALNGNYGEIQPYQSPQDIVGSEAQQMLVSVIDGMVEHETDADYIAALEQLKTTSPSAILTWSESDGYVWNNVTWPTKPE